LRLAITTTSIAIVAALLIAPTADAAGPISNLAQARSFLKTARGNEWWPLHANERQLVARAYLDGPGERYQERVTPAALIAEIKDQLRSMKETYRWYVGRHPLSAMLRDATTLANARAIGAARARWLPSKRLIGRSIEDVRRLIGPPDHTQDIAGHVYWLYDWRSNTYQLVIDSGRVVAQNKF
jgi:hypothetical protein